MKIGTPGFRGERLREAREARRINGTDLAAKIGVTSGSISQYEKNLQSPRPEIAERLSKTLELPLAFFLRDDDPRRVGTVYYRSLASAAKSVRNSALRRHAWLRHIAEWVQTMADLPDIDFPDFEPPSDPALLSSHIERFAEKTRRHWSLTDGPISNVVWLLETKGAVVSLCDFGSEDLDAFSECGIGKFQPFVSVSSSKSLAARANFTAAHELGHLLLHRNIPESVAWSPAQHKEMESQANDFASAFLLPEATFRSAVRYPSLEVFQSLKAHFRVSIGAMIMRCKSLNMITQAQYERLWVNYSKRGWKHGEPFDDILERGGPRTLARAFELLFSEGIVTPDVALAELPYAPRDIETLCGLPQGCFESSATSNLVRLRPRETLAASRRAQSADIIPLGRLKRN